MGWFKNGLICSEIAAFCSQSTWFRIMFEPNFCPNLELRFQLGINLFGYVKYVFDQLKRLARLFDQRLGNPKNQTVYLFVHHPNTAWWNIKYVQNIDINFVSNSQSNWHVVKNMASAQMSFHLYKSSKVFSLSFSEFKNSKFEQDIFEKLTLVFKRFQNFNDWI